MTVAAQRLVLGVRHHRVEVAEQQAIDRVHRIGQEMPVTAWRIIAAHTIDSKIAALGDWRGETLGRVRVRLRFDGDEVEVS